MYKKENQMQGPKTTWSTRDKNHKPHIARDIVVKLSHIAADAYLDERNRKERKMERRKFRRPQNVMSQYWTTQSHYTDRTN